MSVVIPARDEAHNLPRLLTSLRRLTPPGAADVIVVDDASSDASGELARALGACVLRLEEGDRPEGWMGKPHACWRGASAAGGEWLLFLDADTALAPAAVQETLAYARRHELDALSVLLQQRCRTFWERLLLPFAYQQLFAGIGAEGLTGGRPQGAMLNGQFVLVRRGAYTAVGGHGARAVRESIVEDMALGQLLAGRGFRIATLRGERLGSVRMYRDLASIREGFGKNAHAFLAGQPGRGARVALASASAGVTLPLLGEAGRLAGRQPAAATVVGGAALAAWAALGLGLAGWTRRYGVSPRYALAQPLAATVFNAIAVESSLRSLSGRAVTWKGRRYRVRGAAPGAGWGQTHSDWLEPTPRIPRPALRRLAGAMWRRERNSLRQASEDCTRALEGRWEAHGVQHIPTRGPVCVVANHWQRPALWIGWGAALLTSLVGQARPDADPPVHWLALTELRLPVGGRERHLWPADPVLRRVVQAWDMVPVELERGAVGRRAGALRTLRRMALEGRVVGFFPEGHQGRAGTLGSPLPGAERFLGWLERSGVALVPAAIYEAQGRLVVRSQAHR